MYFIRTFGRVWVHIFQELFNTVNLDTDVIHLSQINSLIAWIRLAFATKMHVENIYKSVPRARNYNASLKLSKTEVNY